MSDVGILWFIMRLQLVGTNVSVRALEFTNGFLEQQGIFISNLTLKICVLIFFFFF